MHAGIVMRHTLEQAPRVWLRRFSGVTLMFVIAVLVAPLFMGLLQCMMPCCQADATPGSSAIAAVNPCPTATCAIQSERPTPRQAAATIAAREVASERNGEVVITLASRADTGSTGLVLHLLPGPSPRGTDAPLHVLNSTFRI